MASKIRCVPEVVALRESGKEGSLLENQYEANASVTIFIWIMDADCLWYLVV
jgi:hypothetical protein